MSDLKGSFHTLFLSATVVTDFDFRCNDQVFRLSQDYLFFLCFCPYIHFKMLSRRVFRIFVSRPNNRCGEHARSNPKAHFNSFGSLSLDYLHFKGSLRFENHKAKLDFSHHTIELHAVFKTSAKTRNSKFQTEINSAESTKKTPKERMKHS